MPDAQGDQMRTSDPPELEFQVVELPRQYWEPNLAPLWEQPMLLTPGPSLQSPQMPGSSLYFGGNLDRKEAN